MFPNARVHRLSAVLVLALSSSACAGPTTEASSGAESDCRDALRDLQTWCAQGIGSASNPGMRFNCLDARLRADRSCYPQGG